MLVTTLTTAAVATSESSTPEATTEPAAPDSPSSDSSDSAASATESSADAVTTSTATSSSASASASSTSVCKSCGQTYSAGSDYASAHSFFRGLYGLSGLTEDADVASGAAAAVATYDGSARTCGSVQHDGTAGEAGEGENLWAGWANYAEYQNEITINDAVNDWMSEDSDYFSWSNNGADPTAAWNMGEATKNEVGHFTQIVWSSTTLVGCAKTLCMTSAGYYGVMVACRYKT
ncbi:hypothetical protein HK405_014190 [Cladochytrium tenue]|nr:hypothetical protein HK405_014190 [Cladochytrium tenue]